MGKIEQLTIQLMPSNTTRIAKNTLMLYFRQTLIMLVAYTRVRVVLNTLGAEDYEICFDNILYVTRKAAL
jgi:hypothetical protein